MNDPNKRIDVNISSLLSLKAELLRKQEEVNRVKSTKSIENFVPSKIPKPENSSSKSSVVQNQENVSGPDRSIEDTAEDIAMLAKSKRVLEQKSKYYERMTKAGGSLNSDENCLVMFNKKMQDTKILDDSSDDSDSFDEGKDDYSSTNPEEDWVEYTDCFGRTRKCLRKDLEFMKRKDGNVSSNVGTKPEEVEPPPTPWIIDTEGEKSKNDSGDDSSDELLKMGIKEQMKKDWEQKERENVDKEFIHYQDVLFDDSDSTAKNT